MEPDREMEKDENGRVIVVVLDSDVSSALALEALNLSVDYVMLGLSFSALRPGDSVYSDKLSIGQIDELLKMEDIRVFKMYFNIRRSLKEREGPGQMYNMGQLGKKAVVKVKEVLKIETKDTEFKL